MEYCVRFSVHPLARTTHAAFTALASALLQHPRGWRSHGYSFQVLSPSECPVDDTPVMTIMLTPQRVLDQLFPQFHQQRLSVCNMVTREVYLNEERWLGEHPDNQSKLPLTAYRAYMVNHEVGHALNLGHATCPGPDELTPIMVQQTLGTQGCTPNPFPRHHKPF